MNFYFSIDKALLDFLRLPGKVHSLLFCFVCSFVVVWEASGGVVLKLCCIKLRNYQFQEGQRSALSLTLWVYILVFSFLFLSLICFLISSLTVPGLYSMNVNPTSLAPLLLVLCTDPRLIFGNISSIFLRTHHKEDKLVRSSFLVNIYFLFLEY